MNRSQIVLKAKLKKKRQAEREAENAKRPKFPWRKASDSAGQSFGAITEKITFKQFLEAQYATSEKQYNCSFCHTTYTERESTSVSPNKNVIRCPNCKHRSTKQGTSMGWLHSELSDEELKKLHSVTEARYYQRKQPEEVWGFIRLSDGREANLNGNLIIIDGEPYKFNPLPFKPEDITGFGELEIGDEANIFVRYADNSTDTFDNIDDIQNFFKYGQVVKEARYYRQKEDWQEDINDYGQSIAVCPRCGGEAEGVHEGETLADAKWFWECRDCGHTGPEHRY